MNNEKIDISILITSITQREITINTARYYSEICNEVIIVDEEKPHLSHSDIEALNNKGIIYIPYKGGCNKTSLYPTYEKRLIAAINSNKNYVVHSNHDERYTYKGLMACVTELENNTDLTFCVGQCVAVRRDNIGFFYTRSYECLKNYQNINKTLDRLYYHADIYAPVGHYGVWRKEQYIYASKKTLFVHNAIPSTTMMEEVIFGLAADRTGNSKAVPELFWIRNRINPPSGNSTGKGKNVFAHMEKKFEILFSDLNNVKIERITKSFWKNFPFIRLNFYEKTIIFFKRNIRKILKKKKSRDIIAFLQDDISYDENDLLNALESLEI